jgi:hypothetical protein
MLAFFCVEQNEEKNPRTQELKTGSNESIAESFNLQIGSRVVVCGRCFRVRVGVARTLYSAKHL